MNARADLTADELRVLLRLALQRADELEAMFDAAIVDRRVDGPVSASIPRDLRIQLVQLLVTLKGRGDINQTIRARVEKIERLMKETT